MKSRYRGKVHKRLKMKKTKNKLVFEPLDAEEKELMESIENEEWEGDPQSEKEITRIIKAAKSTLKDTKMNIRISSSDKEELEKMAAEEGIPYQTFIRSILHKYRIGRLIDVKSARKVLRALKKSA